MLFKSVIGDDSIIFFALSWFEKAVSLGPVTTPVG